MSEKENMEKKKRRFSKMMKNMSFWNMISKEKVKEVEVPMVLPHHFIPINHSLLTKIENSYFDIELNENEYNVDIINEENRVNISVVQNDII